MHTRRTGLAWLRAAALVSALAAVTAAAQTNAPCPPPPLPANPNGNGPVYFPRDSASCRIFSWQLTYDPQTGQYSSFWLEVSPAMIKAIVDRGFQVIFVDQAFAGGRIQVVEFFNTGLNHYHLAWRNDELEAIDQGAAGPGWVRTGYGFTARTVTSPSTTANVCRFYGSVSPGPNSHFFTADPQECLALRNITAMTPADQPRWNYEGLAFNAFPVSAAGTCASYQVPIWRAFNGGPAQGIESNHRYSADKSVIDGMVSRGWLAEGIAFCVDTSQ